MECNYFLKDVCEGLRLNVCVRACVRARAFDFCVHAQTLVWTAVLYHGEKRSAPRFTSDQPSVLATQRPPVPPVSVPNTPFSVLTLR